MRLRLTNSLTTLLYAHSKSSSSLRSEFLQVYCKFYLVRKPTRMRGHDIEDYIRRGLAEHLKGQRMKFWNEDNFFTPSLHIKRIAFHRKPMKLINSWQVKRNVMEP